MFSLVLKLMKKACTVWHSPGLEGNQTARILAVPSICRFVRAIIESAIQNFFSS
jgi:hypothetical protein